MRAGLRSILLDRPGWVLSGAAVDLDFANSRYYGGLLSSHLSTTRAQTVTSYAANSNGLLVTFAANTPRITTLGLLVEPASTNLVLFSNDLTQAQWSSGSVTPTFGFLDPSGASTASKLSLAVGTGARESQAAAATFVSGTAYTISAYIAPGSGVQFVQLPFKSTAFAGSLYANFDITNGVLGTTSAGVTSTISRSANGFYRLTATATATASTTTNAAFIWVAAAANSAFTPSFTAAGTEFIYVWGVQVEAWPSATSPIPTAGATVTRNADNVVISGALATALASATGSLGIATSNSTAATTGTLIDSNGNILLGKTSSDFLTNNIVADLTTANAGVWTGATKAFISWSPSGRSLSLNLGAAATDASAMTPATTFHLGSISGSSAFLNGYVSRMTAWRSVVPPSFFNIGFVPGALEVWGDSLTVGNQDGSGKTYPKYLSALYNPPRTINNDGISGNTSVQILTRFQAAPTKANYGSVIWSGRNNYSSGSQVQSDIAAMVSGLSTNQFLVLSVINGEFPVTEYSGGVGYSQIIALNSALSATYGSNYLDVRALLVAAYNPAIGPDVVDHSNDVPPYSLRAANINGTLSGALNNSDTAFTTSGIVSVGNVLLIESEYILLTGVTGTTSVTSCIRGYGGSAATSHSDGQAYVGTDNIHLNSAGYALIANSVYARIQSLGGW